MAQVTVIQPTTNKDKSRLRIAAYCRVSSDSIDQLESFANQVDHYTSLIDSNNSWELVGIYADAGLSGTRSDARPDFQRLLRDCRRGKIDKIITKSISRFSRNTKDCLASIRELKTLGVEVFFEKEKLDTGCLSGEILLGFYGTLAQEESVSISSNMRISYKHRMQSGSFITTSAPFGYHLTAGKLIIKEDEAETVRFIFDSYTRGLGVPAIAATLTERGVVSARGSTRWNTSTIFKMLGNEKYIGDVLQQKTFSTDTFPYSRKINKGERDQRYIRNNHPAIITREQFGQALMLRKARREKNYHPKTCKHPLAKMIICGECGHGFKRRVCNQKTYWVCYNHFRDSRTCPTKQISEQSIEDAFVRMWNKLQSRRTEILGPVLSGLELLRAQVMRKNKWLHEIENSINEATEQNHVLNQLHVQGYIDSAIFMQKSNELRNSIDDLLRNRRLMLEHEEDTSYDDTKLLMETLEAGPESIQTFDGMLFEDTVSKIIATSRNEIRFRLINGLELAEAIKRGR